MQENLRENIPLPLTDPEAVMTGGGCCRSKSELTRSISDASALTVDNSKRFSLNNASANATPGQYTEWTDEKHGLYLNFLEASFVKQLHRSIGLRGWRSQELPANTRNSCNEFIVQRGGCWQKVNFETNEPLLDSTADSHVILESPWIRHFTSAGKRRTQTSLDPQEDTALRSEGIPLGGNPTFSLESARSLEQHPECHLRHQNSVGSTTEVSDQNFVDEDQREKSTSWAKRLKTAAADASSNDQVVPLGMFTATDVSPAISHDSSEKEQVHQKLLAEQPETFVCPKSNLHYFLRGS